MVHSHGDIYFRDTTGVLWFDIAFGASIRMLERMLLVQFKIMSRTTAKQHDQRKIQS